MMAIDALSSECTTCRDGIDLEMLGDGLAIYTPHYHVVNAISSASMKFPIIAPYDGNRCVVE